MGKRSVTTKMFTCPPLDLSKDRKSKQNNYIGCELIMFSEYAVGLIDVYGLMQKPQFLFFSILTNKNLNPLKIVYSFYLDDLNHNAIVLK